MKKQLTLLALALTTLCANAQKPIELFNGKNLDGWSTFTKDISDTAADVYSVKGKCIDISGKFGYIYTNEQYSNYRLSLEWRWVDEATNSGVFLSMQGENKAWPSCYEVQLFRGSAGDLIHANGPTSDEFIASGQKNHKANQKGVEKPTGEWNHMEVTCADKSIIVYINGVKQNEVHNISHDTGHIGLQSEGTGIQFRNVELTPLAE